MNRVIAVRKFRAYSLGVSREKKVIKAVRARKYIRMKGGKKKEQKITVHPGNCWGSFIFAFCDGMG